MRHLVEVAVDVRSLDVSTHGGVWVTLNSFNVRCWTAEGPSSRRADALRVVPYVGVLVPASDNKGSVGASGAFIRNDALVQDISDELAALVLTHLSVGSPVDPNQGSDVDAMSAERQRAVVQLPDFLGATRIQIYRPRVAFGESVRAIIALATSSTLREVAGMSPTEAPKYVHSILSKVTQNVESSIRALLLEPKHEDPLRDFSLLADGSVFRKKFASVLSIEGAKSVELGSKDGSKQGGDR